MAVSDLSPALRASASSRPHPKARPGYGKRSVPEQCPPREADFTLLPDRERHIAGYVDALPEGAAMDIKSLARSQPLYGQMAVGSALRALGVAGHLRHVRCLSGEGDQVRWVTRTFWSRTAHDNEWWTAFLAAEEHHPAPQEATEAVAPAPVEAPEPEPAPVPARPPALVVPQQRTAQPQPQPRPGLSPAFAALARLGRADSRLALSAADCAALEQAAAEWFARGVDADYLTNALTAGLPASVDSPFGFVRRRLRDKLPPRLPATTPVTQATPVRRLMVECTECGAPGRPEAFRDGLCRPCRELDPA
ncbi:MULTISPECIES: MarR family transcriptional regulator [Streptomyces]|uniref:MarR family transcriptional regulator n=1 Tax=Streptomyces TaxID=1883 RepID=UPI0021A73F6C|nr:MarR family transcriptional regulator [Streptomyces atratus]MCT2545909.1 MarR family transcriptional regulator [Streptomyces atratus]